ncbi:MAG: hypothetical protein WBM41_12035 [Arenicellales bacterium]
MGIVIELDSTFLIRFIDLNPEKFDSLKISFENCLDTVDKAEEIAVDEVARLIDIEVVEKTVLSSLEI